MPDILRHRNGILSPSALVAAPGLLVRGNEKNLQGKAVQEQPQGVSQTKERENRAWLAKRVESPSLGTSVHNNELAKLNEALEPHQPVADVEVEIPRYGNPALRFLFQNKTEEQKLSVHQTVTGDDVSLSHCSTLGSEMLAFTRVPVLFAEAANLDQWLDAVIAEQAVPPCISIERKMEATDATLVFDGGRLRRAVVNIFENGCHAAAEAAQSGSGAQILTVATRVRSGRFEITVSDTGLGIDESVMPQIFEPLFSTKSFGIGLGMSTAKHIMEAHGGGIDVISAPDCGTTVALWLPLSESSLLHGAA